MQRLKISLLSLAVLTTGLAQTACIGPFKLTTKLHAWNSQLGDKFINALVFFVLLPVYALSLVGDAIIFNTIEFWSGSNPITMKEGEIEKEIMLVEGRKFEVTATKNQFAIQELGVEADPVILRFDENNLGWDYVVGGKSTRIVDFLVEGEQTMAKLNAGEETLTFNIAEVATKSQFVALLKKEASTETPVTVAK